MTDDIVAFIRARLDEDAAGSGDIHDVEVCALIRFRDAPCDCGEPARVLRGVEARRRIAEWHEPLHVTETEFSPRWICKSCDAVLVGTLSPCPTLRALATEWSDHADYRQEWTP